MHYLSAENLTKSYGITPLFKGISFNINEGDKIALIARNGVGKSTLLKILYGQETQDEGKFWIHKDVSVALFEQDPVFVEDKTVLENIFDTQHPVLVAIREYEAAADSQDMDRLADKITLMDDLGAWDYESQVQQILSKLNIAHLQNKVSTLSGGQRKRVALAKTLINIGFEHKHTFLMMDEPTNHLDVEMVEWLEHYLSKENVTLLLVTHDRYFLDAVCNEVWELEREHLYEYKGDYQNYVEKKAARIDSELSSIDKAKNTYRKELEWMRKQPKARTTKSKSRQDNFYEVEKQAKQKVVDSQLTLQVKMNRLGGKVAEMKKVYKSYGDNIILKGFDYSFSKGERIGIIGKNGVGKSTFLNLLQGYEPPDSGKINVGETVLFGNFAQQGLEIKDNIRVIEYVKNIAENFPLANGGSLTAAKFLELFLFSPEKQYTYLNALSGGEKKRLQLLSILFRNPNFLILDEPTNDLDLPTLSVLENFLNDYQGCVLLVSHDRYFMDRLVDHLFVFEGDGVVKDFPGNYTTYRILQKENGGDEKKEVADTDTRQVAAPLASKTNTKLKREFELLEKEIAALEKERDALSNKMSIPTISFDELQIHSTRMIALTAELATKENRWLELSELIG